MKTVLIVEDELRIREGLSHLIQRLDMGFKVADQAENGHEGLLMAQNLEPDVIITDIEMPKLNGLEMIERIQDLGISCTFVILSGYANFEYAQQGLRLGVKDYLLKPVTVSDVRALLEKLAGDTAEEAAPQADEGAQDEYSPAIQKMVQAIHTSYGSHLSLDAFASQFHLTTGYLSNLFVKETGATFSSYVRRVRMEKAKEMLLGTDRKVYEIACAVGYPDQKYFSKVFREYTGTTPKQFAIEHGRTKAD